MRKDGSKPSARRPAAGDTLNEPEKPAEGDTYPRLGPLDGFIGFHLRLAQHASFRAFARRAGLTDLNPGRFAALMMINLNPGIALSQLGRAIARDKSSVTPLVRQLERDGLVKRLPSTTDRRSVSLMLTRDGQKMLRQLLAHAVKHDRKLDAIVGAQKPELLRLLRMIADRMV